MLNFKLKNSFNVIWIFWALRFLARNSIEKHNHDYVSTINYNMVFGEIKVACGFCSFISVIVSSIPIIAWMLVKFLLLSTSDLCDRHVLNHRPSLSHSLRTVCLIMMETGPWKAKFQAVSPTFSFSISGTRALIVQTIVVVQKYFFQMKCCLHFCLGFIGSLCFWRGVL